VTEAEKAYAAAERQIEATNEEQAEHMSFDAVVSRALTTLPESIKRLTSLRSLDLRNTQIADLMPLSQLTGLAELHLEGTEVTDLTPLSSLTGLTELRLDGTKVTDLTPLSSLTGLTELHLDRTEVTDLTPLSSLTGLTELRLDSTKVTDLTPLSSLTGLMKLDLDLTSVADLTALSGLTGLTDLSLSRTEVTDLTPLSGLKGLTALRLNKTGVTDLTLLANMTGLTVLDLGGTIVTDLTLLSSLTGLTTLDLSVTNVTDLTPLSHLTGLTELNLDRTGVTNLTPLSHLTGLTELNLSRTGVTNLTPLSSLTGLWDLRLSGSSVTELSTLTGLRWLWLNDTGVTDLTPLSGSKRLTTLCLNGTAVIDLTPLTGLKAMHWLELDDTKITDLSPLRSLSQLNDLHLNRSAVTDLRPLLGLDRLISDPAPFDGGLQIMGCAACDIDPRIGEIAEIEDDSDRARALFEYLEDWVPMAPSIPTASPAPLMVKIEDGRMRRNKSGDLPENDAMTRAEMGWVALKAYRDSFRASFNIHNYAPLPGVLNAFDTAMSETFDPQRMILIGVMGTRIVNLSDDRRFLDSLPDGAETDLRGFAAQISIFLNRFPDWVTYLEEAETNDATVEAVKAERSAFDDLGAALSESGMVESEVTEEFAIEIAVAAGDDADATASKGLIASTREIVRELSEVAFEEVKNGGIARKDIGDMNQIADGEFAKLRFWSYGWPLVVLKRKQAALRRLANRFPARLGWLLPVLDYLIGADEDG